MWPRDAKLVPPDAKRVFKGIIYDVYHWQQPLFDGTTATFEMLKRQDSVKVIAVRDSRIVFVEDEQPGSPAHIALPGGRHDIETEGELACAKRELLEETGMSFATWKLVGVRQLNDEMDWLTYLFLATDFIGQVNQHNDGGERTTIHELSYDEAIQLEPRYATLVYALETMRQAGSLSGVLALPEYH
ncbi:MAG TPA: NUDIX domain-containing protein [Candidatus Saccharimonadales bacterium]|nr:NUDIX domain-containing protein [Candidatus Saccharimonadales bacterium]